MKHIMYATLVAVFFCSLQADSLETKDALYQTTITDKAAVESTIDIATMYPSQLYIPNPSNPTELIINQKALQQATYGLIAALILTQKYKFILNLPLLGSAISSTCEVVTIKPDDALTSLGLLAGVLGVIPLYFEKPQDMQKNVCNAFATALVAQQIVAPGLVTDNECRNAFIRSLAVLSTIGGIGKFFGSSSLQSTLLKIKTLPKRILHI